MASWLDTTRTTTDSGAIHTRWNYDNDSVNQDHVSDTVNFEQWKNTESERIQHLETIQYLKETVIPKMRERMQIQANHLIETRDALEHANKRIALLENGVKRSRNARKEASFLRKENKRLKKEIIQAEKWSENMGEAVYNCVRNETTTSHNYDSHLKKLQLKITNLEVALENESARSSDVLYNLLTDRKQNEQANESSNFVEIDYFGS
tara:strand:- start:18 stop:641 length:624 start_codon:yes stop_codon:yes gene_type:complete